MTFLSQEWFNKVAELRGKVGELDLPSEIADSIINLSLSDAGDGALSDMHIKGGDFFPGHNDGAEVSVTTTSELVRKVFLELDTQAGMQAFFSGEIKVDGDMSKLMALRTYQPNDKQKALIEDIKQIS